ncbi:MAG: HAD family hydrolase [Lachnospiraceae bacterium]|nr:HAD family hydrolase [Lachnospiraceae bacterium]
MRINGKNITTIVSDFDGTILKKGAMEAPKEFFEVINQAMEQGYLFVAASGRQYYNMFNLLQGLNMDIVYICENGCLVMYRGEVIHKETIDSNMAKGLIEELQAQGGGSELIVSGENTCYVAPHNPGFADVMEQKVKYHITRLESFAQVQEAPLKISIYYPGGIPEEKGMYFKDRYGKELQVVDAGNGFLDFNPLTSGKGPALKVVAEKLGFKVAECVSFGDSENDMSMLQTTGVAFAMETAKPHVKAVADYVCDSVEEVLTFLMEEEARLQEWVHNLAISAGKSHEESNEFWQTLKADVELLEELEYYAVHGEFLCKYKVAGYTVTDILVWQVDHFKAYLDRREEINRYRQDKLLYNSFEILLQMRQNPEVYVNKLQGETGTDYESKF